MGEVAAAVLEAVPVSFAVEVAIVFVVEFRRVVEVIVVEEALAELGEEVEGVRSEIASFLSI